MFLNSDIIEFLNKIINQDINVENSVIKDNIRKFKDYLELTKMCDEATLADIDIVLECLDEFVSLKRKLGRIDVSDFIESRDKDCVDNRRLIKSKQSEYDRKHYVHYISGSSGCGSSVGTSYSSGCGSTPSYRSC